MGAGRYDDDMLAAGRRGTIRVVLVGVAALAIVAAAVAGIAAWAASGPSEATALPTTVATASADPSAAGAAALAVPAMSVEMPADLVWRDVGGVALPYSASLGPRNALGGLATGFAHDPAGAVLAAAHIITRINPQFGPNIFGPTLRDQVVGPDVEKIRTTITQAYTTLRQQSGVAYGEPTGPVSAALQGFRVEDYTDAESHVRLIVTGPNPRGGTQVAALILQLRWLASDWVVVVPPGGDFVSANTQLDSQSTYTPFAGR